MNGPYEGTGQRLTVVVKLSCSPVGVRHTKPILENRTSQGNDVTSLHGTQRPDTKLPNALLTPNISSQISTFSYLRPSGYPKCSHDYTELYLWLFLEYCYSYEIVIYQCSKKLGNLLELMAFCTSSIIRLVTSQILSKIFVMNYGELRGTERRF